MARKPPCRYGGAAVCRLSVRRGMPSPDKRTWVVPKPINGDSCTTTELGAIPVHFPPLDPATWGQGIPAINGRSGATTRCLMPQLTGSKCRHGSITMHATHHEDSICNRRQSPVQRHFTGTPWNNSVLTYCRETAAYAIRGITHVILVRTEKDQINVTRMLKLQEENIGHMTLIASSRKFQCQPRVYTLSQDTISLIAALATVPPAYSSRCAAFPAPHPTTLSYTRAVVHIGLVATSFRHHRHLIHSRRRRIPEAEQISHQATLWRCQRGPRRRMGIDALTFGKVVIFGKTGLLDVSGVGFCLLSAAGMAPSNGCWAYSCPASVTLAWTQNMSVRSLTGVYKQARRIIIEVLVIALVDIKFASGISVVLTVIEDLSLSSSFPLKRPLMKVMGRISSPRHTHLSPDAVLEKLICRFLIVNAVQIKDGVPHMITSRERGPRRMEGRNMNFYEEGADQRKTRTHGSAPCEPHTQTNHMMSISTGSEPLTIVSESTSPVIFMATVSCPNVECEGTVSVPVMLNSMPFPPTHVLGNTYEDVSCKRATCAACNQTVRVSATLKTEASIELDILTHIAPFVSRSKTMISSGEAGARTWGSRIET
ncbi:hypothetical protein PHLGIDRAFT_15280 [Phlebiopsis gigantea 11061_1 CR5-6]|uniref:Uncharacterized protein n=1 Tax=Phlebiopsis gigantea (strain 11061_1 CR5-6) TaxID=745531 RepID=A0A0C3S3B1_PHLG1|nr:hypothetical protein PHLGIDRAFT_15280 [Phlebiopsis gigantea 11061_1 CR5-6]